jgi:endo-1,4-beta-xylanase
MTESLDQASGKSPGTETPNPLVRRAAITPGKDGIHINRRDFIRELGALGLAQWAAAAAWAQAATAPLQLLAAEKGLLFGSCLALKYFVKAPAYQQLFLAQCNIATPEVHMKWDSLSSQPGVYDFASADSFVAFCATNRLRVRGHALLWHQALPAWASPQLTAGNGQALMADHIRTVAGHFAGRLYSWDVVNEVLDTGSNRPDGLRDSPWLRSCGVDYIAQAFRATAAADSNALLIWNENYLEVSNGFGWAKRKAMLVLLDGILARGVPIHGIGIEAHLRAEQAAVLGDASYQDFLGELARRGMKIFITELDVQDVTLPADIGARDQAVAALYRKFLTASLQQPAVKAIVTWGLADSFTWIASYRPRKDGLPVRPLPFDANFQPKAAAYAIAETLQSAPRRNS